MVGARVGKKGSRKGRREEQGGLERKQDVIKEKNGTVGPSREAAGLEQSSGERERAEPGEVGCGQGQTLQGPISQVKDLILSQDC